MPTETFHNLPPPKRERLMATALEEFAAHDYNTASISQIVARAGIAKGSIYQYFEDKRDLYLHLVKEASQVLLEEVEALVPPGHGEGDLFDVIRAQMSATVTAAATHPLHARLLERAYTTGPLADQVREGGRQIAGEHFAGLIQAAADRGELRSGVDPEVAAFVIGAVMGEAGRFLAARLGLDPSHPDPAGLTSPEAERTFDEIIAVLREGLAAESPRSVGR